MYKSVQNFKKSVQKCTVYKKLGLPLFELGGFSTGVVSSICKISTRWFVISSCKSWVKQSLTGFKNNCFFSSIF